MRGPPCCSMLNTSPRDGLCDLGVQIVSNQGPFSTSAINESFIGSVRVHDRVYEYALPVCRQMLGLEHFFKVKGVARPARCIYVLGVGTSFLLGISSLAERRISMPVP